MAALLALVVRPLLGRATVSCFCTDKQPKRRRERLKGVISCVGSSDNQAEGAFLLSY